MAQLPSNVQETKALLASGGYVASEAIATSVFLALKLKRPLLLEGEAGVGKTELAIVLANVLERPLVRLHLTDRKRLINDTVEMKSRKTFAKMHVGFVNVNADKAKCALVTANRASAG